MGKSIKERLEAMAAKLGIGPEELWAMTFKEFALRVALARRG